MFIESTKSLSKKPTGDNEEPSAGHDPGSSPPLLTGSSRERMHSSTKLVDIPFKPLDVLEWVQIKVKVVDNKVVIGDGNNAITEYVLQVTQRIEDSKDPTVVRIVKPKGEEEKDKRNSSRFTTNTWKIKINVKDLFQALTFYCPSFTDDDIPDRLW